MRSNWDAVLFLSIEQIASLFKELLRELLFDRLFIALVRLSTELTFGLRQIEHLIDFSKLKYVHARHCHLWFAVWLSINLSFGVSLIVEWFNEFDDDELSRSQFSSIRLAVDVDGLLILIFWWSIDSWLSSLSVKLFLFLFNSFNLTRSLDLSSSESIDEPFDDLLESSWFRIEDACLGVEQIEHLIDFGKLAYVQTEQFHFDSFKTVELFGSLFVDSSLYFTCKLKIKYIIE